MPLKRIKRFQSPVCDSVTFVSKAPQHTAVVTIYLDQ